MASIKVSARLVSQARLLLCGGLEGCFERVGGFYYLGTLNEHRVLTVSLAGRSWSYILANSVILVKI